jgi:hypothetical protein
MPTEGTTMLLEYIEQDLRNAFMVTVRIPQE